MSIWRKLLPYFLLIMVFFGVIAQNEKTLLSAIALTLITILEERK